MRIPRISAVLVVHLVYSYHTVHSFTIFILFYLHLCWRNCITDVLRIDLIWKQSISHCQLRKLKLHYLKWKIHSDNVYELSILGSFKCFFQFFQRILLPFSFHKRSYVNTLTLNIIFNTCVRVKNQQQINKKAVTQVNNFLFSFVFTFLPYEHCFFLLHCYPKNQHKLVIRFNSRKTFDSKMNALYFFR